MSWPVVKWVGGKGRLLPDLTWRLPERWGRYFEPFAGGAALFFALAPERAVLGDANEDLAACYRTIATNVEDVIATLANHEASHSPEHFARTRDTWNAGTAPTHAARAAAFLYLNRACFNGLWRVNRAGELNSPWGKRAVVRFDVDNLRAAAWMLRRAEIRAGDYRATLAGVKRGDLVYLDPPYDGTWTGYTAAAFGPAEQRELADYAHRLVRRGVRIMVSNSDTPLIRELYGDWRIDRVLCDRRVNAKGTGRGAVTEVIAMGGYAPSVQLSLPLRRAA